MQDSETFAHSWHILMKGSIVAAGEGDELAGKRGRAMGGTCSTDISASPAIRGRMSPARPAPAAEASAIRLGVVRRAVPKAPWLSGGSRPQGHQHRTYARKPRFRDARKGTPSCVVQLSKLLIHLKSSLWFVPVLCVLAGVLLSFGTIALDRYFDYQALPGTIVGPDASVVILTTIAGSMVSLAALVLTITMVVVQLAMGQFSPRIVQRILRDASSQLAIGLLRRDVRALDPRRAGDRYQRRRHWPGARDRGPDGLPARSRQHRGARRVRAPHRPGAPRLRADRARREGDAQAERHPDEGTPPEHERGSMVVAARKSGVVTKIGSDDLVEEARRVECVLELVPALGEFVPAGAPFFRVHGEPRDLDENRLHAALVLALEPTLDEDVAYGLRLLVDIAERLVGRLAVSGSHDRSAGDRPAARPAQAAGAAADPGRLYRDRDGWWSGLPCS